MFFAVEDKGFGDVCEFVFDEGFFNEVLDVFDCWDDFAGEVFFEFFYDLACDFLGSCAVFAFDALEGF